jgi:16S rRNA (cytosine1402-N4)-methyltransferase
MRTRRSQFSDDPVLPASPEGGGHRSVLLHEAVDSLDIKDDDIVVDATLGGAGHAQAIAQKLGPQGVFIGFDLDADAIARAKAALAQAPCKVVLIEANFKDIAQELVSRGITHITKALFDLGWSSYQLDSGRGFSIHADEPLGMTYAKDGAAVTAYIVVNDWSEQTLADIIYGFGEERYSRRIAKAIIEARQKKPIQTARELSDVVYRAVPAGYRHGKLHPATRTFQALRIAVNDELGAIQQGLRSTLDILAPEGRVAVITFHSLEDRTVKRFFAEAEKAGRGTKLTKKPLAPSPAEIAENRRARSAKLSVFLKHDKETSQDQQIQTIPPAREI